MCSKTEKEKECYAAAWVACCNLINNMICSNFLYLQALLEERKCHCFLLDRLNAMATLYANHHKQVRYCIFCFCGEWKKECLMLVWMAQNAIPFDRLLYRRHFSYVFKQCKRKSHLPLNDFYVPCSIIVCWNFDDRTHKMEAALCQTSHLATRSGSTFNDSGTHISNDYKIW